MEPKFKIGNKVRILEGASMFELVETAESASKAIFKVGDTVRVLPSIREDQDEIEAIKKYASCVLRIEDIIETTDNYFYCLKGTDMPYLFNQKYLELVKDTEQKEPESKYNIEKLEPNVGEVFDYEGKSYICIESNMEPDATCKNCSFRKIPCNFIMCTRNRKDQKDVYFKEIHDIPFVSSDYLKQRYGIISMNEINTHLLITADSGPALSSTSYINTEDKKDSGKSIIKHIMELNKKPKYKLKFKI